MNIKSLSRLSKLKKVSAVRIDKINVEKSPNKLDDGRGRPSVVVSYKQQLSLGSFTWTGKLRTY